MKLKLLQSYLKKHKIGLAFLSHPDFAINYFTQMEPSFAFLLITPNKADLYLSKLDHHPKLKNIKVHNLPKDWKKKFSSKTKTIGINKSVMTVAFKEKLRKIYPHARFKDISSSLNQLRAQKTQSELKKIQHACNITTKALQALRKELPKRTLKTEIDCAIFIENFFRKNGCDVAFPTIVAMGKNAAIPHHITGPTQLRKGFLLIDFGAKYQGYCADCTRVLYLGKPSKSDLEFYHLLKESQQAAIDAVKENIPFTQLDKISRDKLGKYKKYFTHSLGHGIGIEVHEAPTFSNPKTKVQKNIPFTIEPGIYIPNKLGLRIEDTVVLTTKLNILTKVTKDLVIIPF